jgi:ABC-type uncharacterized transport system substrate-binding protein
MAAGGHDLLVTITTASLQAVANANRAGKTPHVFGLVSDPYAAGVGISRENHLDHPPHLTGFATMQPADASLRMARELNPGLRPEDLIDGFDEIRRREQLDAGAAAMLSDLYV